MSTKKPLNLDFLDTAPTSSTPQAPASYRPPTPIKAGPSFLAMLAAVFLGTLAAQLVAGFLAFGAVSSFITNMQNEMKVQQQAEQRNR